MFDKIGFFHFGDNHLDPIGSLRAAIADVNDFKHSLIVLPEYFIQSEYYGDPNALKAKLFSGLTQLAEETTSTFIAGVIIGEDTKLGKPFNSAYWVNSSGEKLICHKMVSDQSNSYRACMTGCDEENPVRESNVAVGTLICLDAVHEDAKGRADHLLRQVEETPVDWKLICIPSRMSICHFPGSSLPEKWKGKFVILANSELHGGMCDSFIADRSGKKIKRYSGKNNKIVLHTLKP